MRQEAFWASVGVRLWTISSMVTAPPVKSRTVSMYFVGTPSSAIWLTLLTLTLRCWESCLYLPRSEFSQVFRSMAASLGPTKPRVKFLLNEHVYSPLNMDEIRRLRLAQLLSTRYKGDRARLISDSGLSKGRISQLLSAEGTFGERAARELEVKLDLPERWLDRTDVENTEPAPDVRGGVPLISWIRAGNWDEASDPLQPGEAEAWVPSLKPTSARAYALRVRGDSMSSPFGTGRNYPEGCIIIVEPERRLPANGERIIAKLEGSNEVTFKIFKEEDGRRWLQPLNPQHPPIHQPFRVLGTVVGKWEDE